MGQYSIKDVEMLSGVKAHTLRIWEQRYDFLKPRRTDTNIRYYTDDQLRMLLNIGILNRNGLKISKIAEMGQDQMSEAVMKLQAEPSDNDQFMDSLVRAMIDYDENRFEKTISSAILKMGFENAFVNVVFPFIARTGVLWSTGAVSVAQEHFISHLIRRKIYVAMDGLFTEPGVNSKMFVLFLPEGETHELLLLFSEYLVRKYGHHAVYLGSSLPLEQLQSVVKSQNPDFIVSYLTIPIHNSSVSSYCKKLLSFSRSAHLVIGGAQVQGAKLPVDDRLIVISALDDFLGILK